MTGDWIKLHRKMLDWEWYDDANTMRVFLHLLLKANWKPNRWRGIDVPVGSLISSYDTLSDELKLSRQQLRTSLKKLKSNKEINKEINTEATRYGLVITICNWASYQSQEGGDQQGNNTLINREATGKQQGSNREVTPLEEGKKERRKEITPPVSPAGGAPIKKAKKKAATKIPRPAAMQLVADRVGVDDPDDPLTSALADWFDHKIERRESYARVGWTGVLGQVEKHGPQPVIDAIRASIASNYAGFFPEKFKQNQSNGQNRNSGVNRNAGTANAKATGQYAQG